MQRIIKTRKANTDKVSRDRKRYRSADKKVKRNIIKAKYSVG